MTIKRCSKCFQEKSVDCFHKASQRRGGYHSFCKECRKARNYEKKFNEKPLKEREMLLEYWSNRRDEVRAHYNALLMHSFCKICKHNDPVVLKIIKNGKINENIAIAMATGRLEFMKKQFSISEIYCCNCWERFKKGYKDGS